MKVLTLNTWGTNGPPERKPALIEAIRELDADILCLQEVVDPQLLSALGAYPARLHAPEGGLAILSKFPALFHRIEAYPTRSPLESYRRQLLLAKLAVGPSTLWLRPEEASPGASALWAATTHLAWKAEDEPTRAGQVEDLLRILEPIQEPILLGGDLNACPDHSPAARIREAGFLDLYRHAHPDDPGTTWDNANPFIQSHSVRFPDRRIDYLFWRPGKTMGTRTSSCPLANCEVVCRQPNAEGLYPSDHYGVLATFLNAAR